MLALKHLGLDEFQGLKGGILLNEGLSPLGSRPFQLGSELVKLLLELHFVFGRAVQGLLDLPLEQQPPLYLYVQGMLELLLLLDDDVDVLNTLAASVREKRQLVRGD